MSAVTLQQGDRRSRKVGAAKPIHGRGRGSSDTPAGDPDRPGGEVVFAKILSALHLPVDSQNLSSFGELKLYPPCAL